MAAFGRAFPRNSDPTLAAALLWEKFRRRIAVVVQDCNCAAHEPIWELTAETGDRPGLRIQGRAAILSCLEISLDATTALLRCTFHMPRTCRWIFHIQPDGATLRDAAREYRVEDAVNAILDRLVQA